MRHRTPWALNRGPAPWNREGSEGNLIAEGGEGRVGRVQRGPGNVPGGGGAVRLVGHSQPRPQPARKSLPSRAHGHSGDLAVGAPCEEVRPFGDLAGLSMRC